MKKYMYKLSVLMFLMTFTYAAGALQSNGALEWYGVDSFLVSDMDDGKNKYMNDDLDDEEKAFRKRRHKRRRNIRPPRRGW